MKANLIVFIIAMLFVLQTKGQWPTGGWNLGSKNPTHQRNKQTWDFGNPGFGNPMQQPNDQELSSIKNQMGGLELRMDFLSEKNADIEKRFQSLESIVSDWKRQVIVLDQKNSVLESALLATKQEVNRLQMTIEGLVKKCGAAVDKSHNQTDGLESLCKSATNTTNHKIPAGRCNVLFPEDPNKFPEVHLKGDNGRTILHFAALNATVDEVCQLLEKGADPLLKDNDGHSALHAAAGYNTDVNVTRLLLEKGGDPNLKNNRGETCLHFAAIFNSNVDVIRLLLEKGADLNLKNKIGYSPLHFSAGYNSNANVTSALLEKGADANQKGNDGFTPLHFAAMFNSNVDVIRLLLEKGADLNLEDNNGRTPLSSTYDNVKISILKQYNARG